MGSTLMDGEIGYRSSFVGREYSILPGGLLSLSTLQIECPDPLHKLPTLKPILSVLSKYTHSIELDSHLMAHDVCTESTRCTRKASQFGSRAPLSRMFANDGLQS